eukprot:scaffold109524_cov28-Prasinocladus_malaysianus.AAC.1
MERQQVEIKQTQSKQGALYLDGHRKAGVCQPAFVNLRKAAVLSHLQDHPVPAKTCYRMG